jgi:molecular chaperone DnaJ
VSKRDYYEVLGIAKSASADEIKRAFRKKAVELHPDRGGDEEQFKELNEAYEVLKDGQKKAAYDQFGHAAGAHQAGGGQYGGGAGTQGFDGFDFSQFTGGGQAGFSGFEDLFGAFFGGARSRPRDVEVSMTIDFREAIFGTTKEITLRVADHQKGERKQEDVKVKIPAGIDDGQSIRLSGHGEVNQQGAKGDLYVHIRVRPDKEFQRQGSHIVSRIKVGMIDAALGTTAEVITLDGKVKVKIPAGTQHGKVLKLTGKGVPLVNNSTRRGDHLIEIKVEVPHKLSAKQKKLLEDFRATEGKKKFW